MWYLYSGAKVLPVGQLRNMLIIQILVLFVDTQECPQLKRVSNSELRGRETLFTEAVGIIILQSCPDF